MMDIDGLILGPLFAIFEDTEPLTYQPASGGSFSVNGIFDVAFKDTDPTPGMEVTTARPVCGIREAEFTAQGKALPNQGDTLIRNLTGRLYQVQEPRADGHGWQLLILNFAGN